MADMSNEKMPNQENWEQLIEAVKSLKTPRWPTVGMLIVASLGVAATLYNVQLENKRIRKDLDTLRPEAVQLPDVLPESVKKLEPPSLFQNGPNASLVFSELSNPKLEGGILILTIRDLKGSLADLSVAKLVRGGIIEKTKSLTPALEKNIDKLLKGNLTDYDKESKTLSVKGFSQTVLEEKYTLTWGSGE